MTISSQIRDDRVSSFFVYIDTAQFVLMRYLFDRFRRPYLGNFQLKLCLNFVQLSLRDILKLVLKLSQTVGWLVRHL